MKVKVKLENTFHGSTCRVVGELSPYQPDDTSRAEITISARQASDAARKLCGIAGCLCANHGPDLGDGEHQIRIIGERCK